MDSFLIIGVKDVLADAFSKMIKKIQNDVWQP